MRSSQSVHVIEFAIRTAAIVIWRSVPACQTTLDQKRFCASGDFKRIVVSRCRNCLCGWKPNVGRTRIRRANRRRRWNIYVRLFMSTAAGEEKGKKKRDAGSLQETTST